MSRTVTLTTMIGRVRRETDQEYDSIVVQVPFITDTFITDALNEGIAEIWQFLATTAPDRVRTVGTISVVAGTEDYALPATFQAIRGVDYPIGDRYVDVHPYRFEERNELQGPWPVSPQFGSAPFRYHVYGSAVAGSAARISFRPVPTAAASVRIHYLAVPAALAAGDDTFDGIIGLERYAVSYAKARVYSRLREQSAEQSELVEMQRIKQSIQAEAGRRDRSGLQTVARVRSRYPSSLFPYRS